MRHVGHLLTLAAVALAFLLGLALGQGFDLWARIQEELR